MAETARKAAIKEWQKIIDISISEGKAEPIEKWMARTFMSIYLQEATSWEGRVYLILGRRRK